MIVLLDLIFTLVERKFDPKSPPVRTEVHLQSERYREWLLRFIEPHRVFLVTARPNKHRDATLARIASELDGWQPEVAFFNLNDQEPHEWKRRVMIEHILPNHAPSQLIAIESNPRSRTMYASFGVPCLQVSPENVGRTATQIARDSRAIARPVQEKLFQ